MIVLLIVLSFSQSNYAIADEVIVPGQPEEVTINISIEEHVYLLVPTTVNILITDSQGNPIPSISGMVYINDRLSIDFITSESGSFSFTWTPEELAVYNLTVITIKTDIYAAGRRTQFVTVEFSFEKLLHDAISELEYIKSFVNNHHLEKKISAIEKDIRKALKYYEKGDYLKAFSKIRHATHSIEKLTKHHKLGESLKDMLNHVAYKLAVDVRYKVKESLEYAEEFKGCLKEAKLRKPKRMRIPSKVLLDKAWKFYDKGVNELDAGRYSKAISQFITAYRLVRIVLHCENSYTNIF